MRQARVLWTVDVFSYFHLLSSARGSFPPPPKIMSPTGCFWSSRAAAPAAHIPPCPPLNVTSTYSVDTRQIHHGPSDCGWQESCVSTALLWERRTCHLSWHNGRLADPRVLSSPHQGSASAWGEPRAHLPPCRVAASLPSRQEAGGGAGAWGSRCPCPGPGPRSWALIESTSLCPSATCHHSSRRRWSRAEPGFSPPHTRRCSRSCGGARGRRPPRSFLNRSLN